jgi:GT2 family glycosyltransferase
VQTFNRSQYEVIVSDDGRQSAKSVVEEFPFARWIEGPHRGPAANRNYGARAASGTYIAFTDDDCLPEPNWLQSFNLAATSSKDLVFEGKTISDYPLRGACFTAPSNETGGYLWSCNFMIQRELFLQLRGFDENFPHPFLEDVDFRIHLQQMAIPFQFVSGAVIMHPQRHMGGILKVLSQYEGYFYLSKKYKQKPSVFGFGPQFFLRSRKIYLSQSTSFFDFSAMMCRVVVEALILLVLTPIWMCKYAKSKN